MSFDWCLSSPVKLSNWSKVLDLRSGGLFFFTTKPQGRILPTQRDAAWISLGEGGGGVRHLTRARIRAPSDGEITSLKTTRHSNTIDNVKAKIDNVKAKIQDKEERRP
jgi:hypothetical protein